MVTVYFYYGRRDPTYDSTVGELWWHCGVSTVVIVWCHCGGTVVAVPLYKYYFHCRYVRKVAAQW